jgi:hypothetical protein
MLCNDAMPTVFTAPLVYQPKGLVLSQQEHAFVKVFNRAIFLNLFADVCCLSVLVVRNQNN